MARTAAEREAILAAYHENADYDLDGSTGKARAFIVACRQLLAIDVSVKRSAHGGRGGNEVELDQTLIERQLNDARQWLAAAIAASSGGSVVLADLSDLRGEAG